MPTCDRRTAQDFNSNGKVVVSRIAPALVLARRDDCDGAFSATAAWMVSPREVG